MAGQDSPSNEVLDSRIYVAVGLVRHVLRARELPVRRLKLGNTLCGRVAVRPTWYVVQHAIGPVCADCTKMLGTTADVDDRSAS